MMFFKIFWSGLFAFFCSMKVHSVFFLLPHCPWEYRWFYFFTTISNNIDLFLTTLICSFTITTFPWPFRLVDSYLWTILAFWFSFSGNSGFMIFFLLTISTRIHLWTYPLLLLSRYWLFRLVPPSTLYEQNSVSSLLNNDRNLLHLRWSWRGSSCDWIGMTVVVFSSLVLGDIAT